MRRTQIDAPEATSGCTRRDVAPSAKDTTKRPRDYRTAHRKLQSRTRICWALVYAVLIMGGIIINQQQQISSLERQVRRAMAVAVEQAAPQYVEVSVPCPVAVYK